MADKFIEVINDEQKINYCIDECNMDLKTGVLIIRGWAFCENGSVDIRIIDLPFTVEHSNRDDVFDAFSCKFDNALNSGFTLTVKILDKKVPAVLEFESVEAFCSLSVNVPELYKYNKNKVSVIYKVRHGTQKVLKVRTIFTRHYFLFGLSYMRRNGLLKFFARFLVFFRNKMFGTPQGDLLSDYRRWIEINEKYDPDEVKRQIDEFSYKPKISILVPVYNVDEKLLQACIDSVINQYYDNWELCIADDCSTKNHIKPMLEEYMSIDDRIKVVFRAINGHISRATNSALEKATGDFIALLDNDDELAPFALYEVVKVLNMDAGYDLIYSDEDKIDMSGLRTEPHFKPNWSPDTLMSVNYISHLGVYRKSVADKLGGFRVGYEGAQDYDFVLRFTEETQMIYHISKVLYHWRQVKGSTAFKPSEKDYTNDAALTALNDAIKRRKYDAVAEQVRAVPFYHVSFKPKETDFISIIIPTRDKADILEKCLSSIYAKTSFDRFEIIIADNGSEEKNTFDLFEKYKGKGNFFVERLEIPFNFSRINNLAAQRAKGNLLLFLNNDIEVISEFWLEEMAGQAIRSEIGAVGVKLLYPNNTVQHCGIVLGVGGVAGNAYTKTPNNELGYFSRLKINYNYGAVTAACLMVKKELFDIVGGFTEEIAVAFNDVDFCIKLLMRGYYNLCIPKVILFHHESISRGYEDTPEKIKRFNNERKYMIDHWEDILNDDPFYNQNLSLTRMFQIKVDNE